jgi:hypothetical protein
MCEIRRQIGQMLRVLLQELEDIVAQIACKVGYNTCNSIAETRAISSFVRGCKEGYSSCTSTDLSIDPIILLSQNKSLCA